MGLDISHDAFCGAYSAFNRFRQAALKAFGGSWPPHDNESLEPGRWYWESSKEENPGLYEFFCHSDCDGEIEPELCGKLADELELLLPKIEELEGMFPAGGHIERNGGYAQVTKDFIAGCREAHSLNEPLEFC